MMLDILYGALAVFAILLGIAIIMVAAQIKKTLKQLEMIGSNINDLIGKIKLNVEKAGNVISGVESAVLSFKSALDNFKNPFSSLMALLGSLIPMIISKITNRSKVKNKPRAKKAKRNK